MLDRYRKKPVVVEAFQLTEKSRWDNSEWPTWMHEAWNKDEGVTGGLWCVKNDFGHVSNDLVVGAQGGPVSLVIGDWLVKGVAGELYPCKPDVFEATYEQVLDSKEGSDLIEPEERFAIDFAGSRGHGKVGHHG